MSLLSAHAQTQPDLHGPDLHGANRHILVIGGGASGVLLTTHLLSRDDTTRVTLIESHHLLGCGIAYSTDDPDHLLNTRVHNMSAFAADPDHFQRWLQSRPEGRDLGHDSFASRSLYGSYLTDLLRPWQHGGNRRLSCLRVACTTLGEIPEGVIARLDDGRIVTADLAVLATGHTTPRPDPAGLISGAWEPPGEIDPGGRVVIIGSGLSMVDQVLSLLRAGHSGPIVAVSRRGLLPRPHAPGKPLQLAVADIPFGAPFSILFRYVRTIVRQAEALGGTWRDAIDGLRPHITPLWQSLSGPDRARFLRHASAWWEVHRHRIPPASQARIEEAVSRGQLSITRGAFVRAGRDTNDRLTAIIRPHGKAGSEALEAARIIDCRGIRNDPERHASPLIAGLLQSGQARLDPLRLGLDISQDCRLVSREGGSSERIFAMGPVSRAAFWEITAIPDIRVQAAALARKLGMTALRPEA